MSIYGVCSSPREGAIMNKAGPENPHSQQKIEQAKKFIELELEPERAFKAAVITESVAQGDASILHHV